MILNIQAHVKHGGGCAMAWTCIGFFCIVSNILVDYVTNNDSSKMST